jgi:hypothetical protein
VTSPSVVTTVESTGLLSVFDTQTTTKLVRIVTDYYWKLTVCYEILVYEGTEVESGKVTTRKQLTKEFVTQSKDIIPYPKFQVNDPIEADITWYGSGGSCSFSRLGFCSTSRRKTATKFPLFLQLIGRKSLVAHREGTKKSKRQCSNLKSCVLGLDSFQPIFTVCSRSFICFYLI